MTSYFSDEAAELFQGSIQAQGQVQPIQVLEKDGELWGIDGMNRTAAAVARGDKTIAAVVVQGEMKDLFLQNVATAFQRGKPRPTEMVKVIKYLTEDEHMDSEQIANETGMSRDKVEQFWTISLAQPAIQEALDEDVLGVTHAYMIARIADGEVQLRVLEQQATYRWPIARLKEHIDSVMGRVNAPPAPPPQPAEVAPQLAVCQFCGSTESPANIAHPPICVGCSGLLHDTRRQERQNAG